MSWMGLKKAINRAGTQVMLKTGHIEQTIDKEFEFEEKRYRMMETNSLKLQKQLRSYLESLRLLTNSQINIGEALSSFYGPIPQAAIKSSSSEQHQNGNNHIITETTTDKEDSIKYSSLSHEYYQILKSLNDECISELEQPYNQTVLNPIARFNSYYVEINEAIKKRAHKQLDYDAMKNKVRKLIEKPPLNDPNYDLKLNEAQKDMQESEKVYDNLNDKLKTELPKLINLRVPFFDPSFEAFVKIQLRFFNENYHRLNKFQHKLDARTREDYIKGNLDKRIDDVLNKMRELNITGT